MFGLFCACCQTVTDKPFVSKRVLPKCKFGLSLGFANPPRTNHLGEKCLATRPLPKTFDQQRRLPGGREAHQSRGGALGSAFLFRFGFRSFIWLSGTKENHLLIASFGAERFFVLLCSACHFCLVIVGCLAAVIYQILSLVRSFSFRCRLRFHLSPMEPNTEFSGSVAS